MKKKYILFVLIGILLVQPFLLADDVPTEINVLNSPPYLVESIPDQSWPGDTNLINAFDLDDYFLDANGDTLNYSSSSVLEINISINPLTNVVSFYPDLSFVGLRNVTFYADDGNYTVSSNPVGLYVGLDNESPTWSSPAKSKGDVYQNDRINFSVLWADNAELSSFIFSIQQGSTWTNYTNRSLSGQSDYAIQEIQISASASTTVNWRMYAWDTSGNMNVTDIQSFVVSTFTGTGAEPPEEEDEVYNTGTSSIREAVENLDLTPSRKLKDFRLSMFDIKLSMKPGTVRTIVLKITNIGTEDLNITMQDQGLWDFVIFNEEEFQLIPGNSKEITIDFDVPRSAYPGEYFGFIWANSGSLNKTVPVVLDINAIDLDYEIKLNISEEFKLVRAKEEANANIYIHNTKDVFDTNATLYYAIKDFTGMTYNFSEEKINFSTPLAINRSLQVPEGTAPGKYIFYARVSDGNSISIDSDVFEVGEKFTFSAFLKSSGTFLLLLLLAFFLAIFMVKYQRDRKKERIIHLYMMLNKLKNLIKQGKDQEALELFLRIKTQYKEPLSKGILQNKVELKKEMLKLYEIINPEALKKIHEQEKQVAKIPSKQVGGKNQAISATKGAPGKQIVNQAPKVVQKPAIQNNQGVPLKKPDLTKVASTILKPLQKPILSNKPANNNETTSPKVQALPPPKIPLKNSPPTTKQLSTKIASPLLKLTTQKKQALPIKKQINSENLSKKEVTKNESK